MENQAAQQPVDQAEAGGEVQKEKKPRKMKKMKREDFIVNAVKGGQRDAQTIAAELAVAANKGEISMKKVHKVPPTPLMWFLQVKWYFHQAKKKGLVDGDLILPPRPKRERKKKEAAEAPAEQATEAAAKTEPVQEAAQEVQSEEAIGSL